MLTDGTVFAAESVVGALDAFADDLNGVGMNETVGENVIVGAFVMSFRADGSEDGRLVGLPDGCRVGWVEGC
jgi:hypothetical protein